MITDINYADDPINGAAEDALGRGPIAAQLEAALQAARAVNSSSVFSLVGGWGSGKSSVISLLTERLQRPGLAAPWAITDFNPWAYTDDEALQTGFYQELLQQLKPHMEKTPMRDAIAKLRNASAGIREVAPLLSMISGPVDAGKLTEMLATALDASGSLSQQMKAASEALERANVPILFILDDVDRLAPAELVMVTKLVRLTGRLPHVHFLLCFDEQTILDVLSRTDLVPDDAPARAQDYLEKIIQLRFDVPPLRRAQTEQLIGDAVTTLERQQGFTITDLQRARLTDAVNMHLVDRLRTPRGIRRLFTQLPHSLNTLGDEVDPVDFLIITWLRLEEPALYAWVEHRRDWILATDAEMQRRAPDERPPLSYAAQLKRDLDRLRVPVEHREGLMRLLGSIFPMLRSDWADLPRPESSVGLFDGPRIGNPDYFGRYFAFGVPEEDIPDKTVTDALTAMTNAAYQSDSLAQLDRMMQRDPELIIRKLRDFITPTPRQVEWFVDRIDTMSEIDTGLVTQRAQLTQLVARLLARLSREDRDRLIASRDDTAASILALAEVGRFYFGINGAISEQLSIYVGSLDNATSGVLDGITSRAHRYADEHIPASPETTPGDFWNLLRAWSRIDNAGAQHWITDRVRAGWDLVATIGGLLESKVTANGNRVIVAKQTSIVERFIDTEANLPQFADLTAMQVDGIFSETDSSKSVRTREAERLLGEYARSRGYTQGA
ncbi:P-loop NTPase fold protein [Curtobacterium sp. MCLR17_031]|uniref:P-loop NTPase fold protein n=1 Tax=Curtobacterium sp. MCLR17_031 TaxID=2175622 RepID=UPI000DA85070|nr:P-loop NTPase fold protein [Curtobacterium sp. MCLR17_031]WIE59193.1 P-loop NTPase fold protein [Curtobacterium sp. MCLR17_031]